MKKLYSVGLLDSVSSIVFAFLAFKCSEHSEKKDDNQVGKNRRQLQSGIPIQKNEQRR